MLSRACQAAMDRLDKAPKVTRGMVSEVHTTLFAVGDCFGTPDAEDQAQALRNELDPALQRLLSKSRDNRDFYPVSRAATYLVTVTARTGDNTSKQLLEGEHLKAHPDRVTERLRTWALRYRFDQDGTVRPIHAARG